MNIKSNHQLWINQYKEIQRSGLSVRSWAIQNNLSATCIVKRIRRLRQMGLIPEARAKTYQKVKSSSHSFVEIPVTDSSLLSVKANSSEIVCKIEFANKASVSITNSISPLLLQKILEVIKC